MWKTDELLFILLSRYREPSYVITDNLIQASVITEWGIFWDSLLPFDEEF